MADTSAIVGAVKSIALALITEAEYLYGVEEQLENLRSNLEYMQDFIQRVDDDPYLLKQDSQLRILTCKIRELAFRSEDAIDTYLVDVRSITYNKNFLLKFMCLASHSYPVHMLRKKVDAIQKDLEDAMSRSEKFRSSMGISTTSQSQGVSVGSISAKPIAAQYLHRDDELVVGIEDEITQLVQRLTDLEDGFTVLGIVGTGGGGKTTLASQIYRHNKVQRSFPHRAFICISQKWSRSDLIHRIYKAIMGNPKNSSTETELVEELYGFMKGKQCLMVLDDIWEKKAWDDISPIFPRTKGFRVVITTRKKEIPLHADKKYVPHEPQMLTNDQMWELFSKHAVEGRHGIEKNVEFENLGKLMLQKCHGLPLAVVTLAGILRTKERLYEWERVNTACKDNILKGEGGSSYGVEDMFELSYLELPSHLKPLFLSLAMIPEDANFKAGRLARMWIAEGFITDAQELRCETLEDVAMSFLDELAQRFIFQVTERDSRDRIQNLRLHDLMKEFCTKKASECQFLEYITGTSSHERKTSKPRRVAIYSREHSFEENNYLRSIFYNSGVDYYSRPQGVIRKLDSIHKEFKLLRVLNIYGCLNDSLPKEIGNLMHLTSLILVNTLITELPESLRNLRNLMYLAFDTPNGGEVLLPDNLVRNMENLRALELYLTLSKRGSGKYNNTLGLSSERHKKLHSLGCGAGTWLTKELGSLVLPAMRDLRFYEVEKIEEMEAIHQWLSLFESNLHEFTCFYNDADDAFSQEHKFDMEKLMEIQSLHTLSLYCPLLVKNMSIEFPPNLVTLHLGWSRITEEVDLMEVLGGLSKLKYLTLYNDAYLGKKLICGGTAFPQLQSLKLVGLGVEEWRVEGRALHRLKKIQIRRCTELTRLPEGIASITTLKELEIEAMPEEFCRRLGYRTSIEDGESTSAAGFGQDSYLIQHIRSVKFIEVKEE